MKENSSSGIGFAGLLTIVFIVLKLLDKITWSWLWVLSPLWIPLILVLAICLVVFLWTTASSFRTKKRMDARRASLSKKAGGR